MRAVFIDTSVLTNLLRIPKMDQDRDQATKDLLSYTESDAAQLILPITTVIETGNHISHIADGRVRRERATTFGALLPQLVEEQRPWVLHGVSWNSDYLKAFVDGGPTDETWEELAQRKVGAGDLCILVEADEYHRTTRIPVSVWTYDTQLAALADSRLGKTT